MARQRAIESFQYFENYAAHLSNFGIIIMDAPFKNFFINFLTRRFFARFAKVRVIEATLNELASYLECLFDFSFFLP
jgi:hypothetical protein